MVSNETKETVRKMTRQPNRPEGLYYEDGEGRYSIWVKTWGQLIQECKGRLQFFQGHLKYATDNESALAYLRSAHAKYLPQALAGETPAPEATGVKEPTS